MREVGLPDWSRKPDRNADHDFVGDLSLENLSRTARRGEAQMHYGGWILSLPSSPQALRRRVVPRVGRHRAVLLILLFAFLLRVGWLLYARPEPVSDYLF